jgi:uncharacterized protein (DUF736 family)
MENNEKPKLEEAGAFWIKTSKNGVQFLTGKVKSKSGEETSVMVFKNKYKTEGSNQPDYRIYFDNNTNVNTGAPSKKESKTVSTPVSEVLTKTEVTSSSKKSEEIPF